MTMLEKYNKLPPGKKNKLRRAYIDAFGGRSSFYRKINKEVRLLKAEIVFFNNNLA